MKVYICPNCGWLRAVSRRKDVECFKCGEAQMELTRIDYGKFAYMDDEERQNYSESWMYIHHKKKGS